MGSRSRSIRLRIYFLVTIPLVALIGLLAYVATTSVNNAINLDRAPSLITATSEPTAQFVNALQDERLAAIVYAFDPTSTSAAADFAAKTAATKADQDQSFLPHLTSSATTDNESGAEAQDIAAMRSQLSRLPQLEAAIAQARLTPVQVYGAYTQAIANEPKLFLDEASTMTDATAANQALGLIGAVTAREELSQEDALLAGMLAAPKSATAAQQAWFAQARAAFDIAASTRQADVRDTDSLLSPANLAVYDGPQAHDGAPRQQLLRIETAVQTGTPIDQLGLTAAQWQAMAGTLLANQYTGGIDDASAQLVADKHIARSAWFRVGYVSGIALAGLLFTILFTTLLGRSIIRRLRGLELTALTLAEQQLPDVIGRLRHGEDVDVAAEAPPLRIGVDEIGRVGQAFDLVRQTAIRSAVEEAKLRRGLNDVFRSLARRSQSLLHRQLTLLDQMERRATDPEALDDLFRLDHLTTRMRRHAEGLVILAGAAPGRGWSSPVRMVDVMRGAIAEVEDYARVSVATRSRAALAGSAVADVIHLLAELIENATTLSPPYTSVRVAGDTVANGFVIEVEDRGLGLSSQRLNDLNERLANPPEFNPSDSEQLGLFVVSQLARRHGIKVTLKSSPYGGTEAVVLIPPHLVVAEDAFRASLPGEHTPAIAMAPAGSGTNGTDQVLADRPDVTEGQPAELHHDPARPQPVSAESQLLDGRPAVDERPAVDGPRIDGPLLRSAGSFPVAPPHGGQHAQARAGTDGFNGYAGAGANGGSGLISGSNGSNGTGLADQPGPGAGMGTAMGTGTASTFDVFSPLRRDAGQPGPGTLATPPAPAGQATPLTAPAPAASPATTFTPVASAPGDNAAARLPWEPAADSGPRPATPGRAEPEPPDGPGQADGEFKGLPRRVRQASIAPQLRGDAAGRRSTGSPGGADPGPTPAQIRATMAALQRGMQEGRSQRPGDGEPSHQQNAEGI